MALPQQQQLQKMDVIEADNRLMELRSKADASVFSGDHNASWILKARDTTSNTMDYSEAAARNLDYSTMQTITPNENHSHRRMRLNSK